MHSSPDMLRPDEKLVQFPIGPAPWGVAIFGPSLVLAIP